MSILSKPYTFSPNTTISSSEMNANFDTLYNDYNGGISAANLADNAVTTAKIADLNVTTAKLADGSVTVNKISNNAITLAYSEVTSNQGGITSETNISGLSVTFDAPNNGRRIEVIVDCHIFSTVAGDTYRLSLKESTTTLQTAEGRLQGANQQQHECIHYSVVPTPGSHTYNVTLTRSTGTGTLSTFQASIRPAFILVKAI